MSDMRGSFDEMSEGERCHMVNLLYKEGYVPVKLIKLLEDAEETKREFDIVDSACDYWKQTAEDLGHV